MSNSSFPHGTNASAVGGVNLNDLSFVHSGTTSVRTGGIRINSNGTVQHLKTYQELELFPLTDWIIPNGAASASYEVRITNLVWVEMDEGFIISPSGSDTYTIPMDPLADGDADGDEDTWFNLGTSREWVFIDDTADLGVGTQHAQFDIQIRLGTTVLATAAMDWFTDKGSGGGGGGGGCFMYGTKFRMADDSLKAIQDIEIGDVMKIGGKVTATQIGDGTTETWFDVDGVIATGSHGVYKDGVWMRVADAGYEPAETQDRFYIVANWGHKMISENGQLFTDYQEVNYTSSGWDQWVMDFLNGDADVSVLREAIKAAGTDAQEVKDYFAREGIYKEDYAQEKNRLLQELFDVEEREAYRIANPVSDLTKKRHPE